MTTRTRVLRVFPLLDVMRSNLLPCPVSSNDERRSARETNVMSLLQSI
jgi:hypothetical protein